MEWLVEPQLAPQRLDSLGVGIALKHLDDHIPRAHMHQQEDQERDQKQRGHHQQDSLEEIFAHGAGSRVILSSHAAISLWTMVWPIFGVKPFRYG